VIDVETRRLLADVTLTIADWKTRDGSSPSARTDAAGRFKFADLRPSGDPMKEVRLIAVKADYETSTSDALLLPGATSHPIKLTLRSPSKGPP
jgi:hypothetical protein